MLTVAHELMRNLQNSYLVPYLPSVPSWCASRCSFLSTTTVVFSRISRRSSVSDLRSKICSLRRRAFRMFYIVARFSHSRTYIYFFFLSLTDHNVRRPRPSSSDSLRSSCPACSAMQPVGAEWSPKIPRRLPRRSSIYYRLGRRPTKSDAAATSPNV